MTENKCGYHVADAHLFFTSFWTQHAPVWRCFLHGAATLSAISAQMHPRILQMHHQNPVVPPESSVHPQNPICTYSVYLYLVRAALDSTQKGSRVEAVFKSIYDDGLGCNDKIVNTYLATYLVVPVWLPNPFQSQLLCLCGLRSFGFHLQI